jgi:hypothetical protein
MFSETSILVRLSRIRTVQHFPKSIFVLPSKINVAESIMLGNSQPPDQRHLEQLELGVFHSRVFHPITMIDALWRAIKK